MLRLTVSLLVAAASLGGCSVAPRSAYSFDPTHPVAKPAADPQQLAPLTNRVAALQDELNALRARIAEQPDAWQRLALYREEHRIHGELGPLQRELAQYASAR